MLLYTTFLDVLDQNFGVADIRKYTNLDEDFSSYTLLIWKNFNVLLTCPML